MNKLDKYEYIIIQRLLIAFYSIMENGNKISIDLLHILIRISDRRWCKSWDYTGTPDGVYLRAGYGLGVKEYEICNQYYPQLCILNH